MKLVNQIVEFLVSRSKKEHSAVVRTAATIFGASIFIAGIPALILWVGKIFDKGAVTGERTAQIMLFICFIIGVPWMLWAIVWQLVFGKGTPVPIVPTKKFLKNGPYRYVRNPMMLGFFLYMLGWAFVSNTWGAFVVFAIFAALLVAEIKYFEEPELEKRFGDAYREYKKEVPFIFPIYSLLRGKGPITK